MNLFRPRGDGLHILMMDLIWEDRLTRMMDLIWEDRLTRMMDLTQILG